MAGWLATMAGRRASGAVLSVGGDHKPSQYKDNPKIGPREVERESARALSPRSRSRWRAMQSMLAASCYTALLFVVVCALAYAPP